jgi:hypothetical protein
MKRFQECNKICKIWRLRLYLLIPFLTLYCYFIKKVKIFSDVENNDYIIHTNHYEFASFKLCYKLTKGDIQIKMKYYYTSEEVFERLNFNKNNK